MERRGYVFTNFGIEIINAHPQVGKDESPLDSVSSWIVPGMLKKGSPQENLAGLESPNISGT